MRSRPRRSYACRYHIIIIITIIFIIIVIIIIIIVCLICICVLNCFNRTVLISVMTSDRFNYESNNEIRGAINPIDVAVVECEILAAKPPRRCRAAAVDFPMIDRHNAR